MQNRPGEERIQANEITMVVKPEDLAIPIIDLEPLKSGTPEEAQETGRKVYDAFKEVGFAYIKNHGLLQELQDQAFEWVSDPVLIRCAFWVRD